MPRKRTRAREVTLQLLYSVDGKVPDADDIERFVRMSTTDEKLVDFAVALSKGCLKHREVIDQAIKNAAGRELRAMAVVDRNVLRLGAYELMHRGDIPAPVVMNEAVELAKRFSTAKSGRFVNGVLDRIHRDLDHRAVTHDAPSEPDGDTEETLDEGGFPEKPPTEPPPGALPPGAHA